MDRSVTSWGFDRGFSTIGVDDYLPADGDAVWEPRRRGTTLQFLVPPVSVAIVLGPLVGVTDGWDTAVLGGLGFAFLLSCVSLLAAAWNLWLIGPRRCIFTDEWVGVQRRTEIDIIRYGAIRTMWAEGEKRFGAWQVAVPTGRIYVTRSDGMPVHLPRLLTYTSHDRKSFLDFVVTEAGRRALPFHG